MLSTRELHALFFLLCFTAYHVEAEVGGDYLDLLPEYDCHHQRCINGHNIKKYKNYSVKQCANACDANKDCYGFEVYKNHGGEKKKFSPGDCVLNTSGSMKGCKGHLFNLDFCQKVDLSVTSDDLKIWHNAVDVYVGSRDIECYKKPDLLKLKDPVKARKETQNFYSFWDGNNEGTNYHFYFEDETEIYVISRPWKKVSHPIQDITPSSKTIKVTCAPEPEYKDYCTRHLDDELRCEGHGCRWNEYRSKCRTCCGGGNGECERYLTAEFCNDKDQNAFRENECYWDCEKSPDCIPSDTVTIQDATDLDWRKSCFCPEWDIWTQSSNTLCFKGQYCYDNACHDQAKSHAEAVEAEVGELKCVTFVDTSESAWGIRRKKNKITRVDVGKQGYDLGVKKGMIIETVDGHRYDDRKYYMATSHKLSWEKPCSICFLHAEAVEAEVGVHTNEAELGGEAQLVGNGLTQMLVFVVLVLIFGVLGFYIGQRKLRKDGRYNLLADVDEVAMVSYQTQKE